MDKLRVGILGASRGMDFAMKLLLGYEYADIAAVCESYPPLLEKTRQFFADHGRKDVLCCSDFGEMLDCGVDAAVIANFANEHAPYAVRALKSGVHVFSEVQPTQTLAEACELCDAVEESGKIYAYGENYCFRDSIFEMSRRCLAGDIGEPVCLEGTFINDCSFKWHLLTRGERDHWRNYVPSTFYCTHSIGPLMYSTGLRAVRVSGAEMPRMSYMAEKGARSGSAAMELMEMSNGGMARSMNGNLRHPYEASYRIIGENGTIESDPGSITVYKLRKDYIYDTERYSAKYRPYRFRPEADLGETDNSIITAFAYFVGAILGDKEGIERTIDVYQALDMSLPGLLAYRSIVNGGAPFEVPDMRDKAVRDRYAGDLCSTDPRTPERFRLPTSKNGTPDVEDEIYEKVKEELLKVDLTPGMK